jgi:hypothetical protein
MNNQALYNKIRILKLHKIYGSYISEMMKCGENLHSLRIRDGEESTFIDVSFKWNRTFNGRNYWSYVYTMTWCPLKDFQSESEIDVCKRKLHVLNRKGM